MSNDYESCKKIEQYIKSMICLNSPASDPQHRSPITPNASPLIRPPPMTPPFDKVDVMQRQQRDLIRSNFENHTNEPSRLIDNEALLRFASENIKEKNILLNSENFTQPFSIAEKAALPEVPFSDSLNYPEEHAIKNLVLNSNDVVPASDSLTSSPSVTADKQQKKKKTKRKNESKAHKRLLNKDLKGSSEKDKTVRQTSTIFKISSVDSLVKVEGDDEIDLVSEGDRMYLTLVDEEPIWELMCFLCDFTATNDHCYFGHFKSGNHKRALKKFENDFAMKSLPDPLWDQEEIITEVLLSLYKEIGLSATHLDQRNIIAYDINKLISTDLPDCSVVLTGSSVSGCGLQNSEVDIILNVSLSLAADRLTSCHDLLLKSDLVTAVDNGFEDKIPKVKFKHAKFGLSCNLIIVDPKRSLPVTGLLSLYCSMDPRVPALTTAFKHFAQLCELDQPEFGTLPSFSFSLMLIYFLQQLTPPVLPVVQEHPSCSKEINCEAYKSNCKWKSENTDSLGLLWVKLLKFYCLQYEPGQDVVSIRCSKKVKCKDKGWGTKFLAIEDPTEIGRNLAHVVPNKCVFSYIMGCFKNAYIYFGYPRYVKGGQLKFKTTSKMIAEESSSKFDSRSIDESFDETDSKNDADNDILEDHDTDLPFDDVISTISKLTMDDIKINEDDELENTGENTTLKNTVLFGDESPLLNPEMAKKYNADSKYSGKKIVFKTCWCTSDINLAKDKMKYIFDRSIFPKNQQLPLVCRLCTHLGHLKKDCPEEHLPTIVDLPPMTLQFLSFLDTVCLCIKTEKQPTLLTLEHNENDRASLQLWIQDVYPDAELELFGSFCNGFGFDSSDLDFCLTFKENKTGEGLKYVEIIEALAKKLATISLLFHVVPITSAKVPIVKFSTKRGNTIRECDISLYNTLAQHNTKMLQAYCSIDERVQIIGFTIKHFAKVLDICDASKGSLSSYAYVLMALFFLQQRKPPVIPVLQELYTGEKPILMVDNWNAWFFDNLNKLKDSWPECGQNKETVGELWLGFLSFYTAEFDFLKYVVSIKQKKPLTRFSKLWQSKKIAIEDPFDLNHNLGAGLSRKMSHYIRKCFIYAREHFGTPFNSDQMQRGPCEALKMYFFNEEALNRGCKPPKDRVCRNCGKIGHVFKNCPVKHPVAVARRDEKQNQNADMGGNRFEKIDSKRAVIGINRNKKLTPRKQYERQPPPKSELPYGNSDMPYMNRVHDPIIRHPMNVTPKYQQHQPPPGFSPHFPSNGLIMRNPLSFPLRPATNSPFPSTSSPFPQSSGSTINHNSSVISPNVNSLLPTTSNPKPWPTNQRPENYSRPNYQNPRWPYRPMPRHNAALNQSNIGAGLRIRNQATQQFPPRHNALDQERSRTNADLGRMSYSPW